MHLYSLTIIEHAIEENNTHTPVCRGRREVVRCREGVERDTLRESGAEEAALVSKGAAWVEEE